MFDKLLATSANNLVTTTNSQLLIDNTNVQGNQIFLC